MIITIEQLPEALRLRCLECGGSGIISIPMSYHYGYTQEKCKSCDGWGYPKLRALVAGLIAERDRAIKTLEDSLTATIVRNKIEQLTQELAACRSQSQSAVDALQKCIGLANARAYALDAAIAETSPNCGTCASMGEIPMPGSASDTQICPTCKGSGK